MSPNSYVVEKKRGPLGAIEPNVGSIKSEIRETTRRVQKNPWINTKCIQVYIHGNQTERHQRVSMLQTENKHSTTVITNHEKKGFDLMEKPYGGPRKEKVARNPHASGYDDCEKTC